MRTDRHDEANIRLSQFYKMRLKFLRSAPHSCIFVLCESQNKQRLFPYTALTGWFVQSRQSVYCAVRAVLAI